MKNTLRIEIEKLLPLFADIPGDAKPIWGTMNLTQMIDHVAAGLEISANFRDGKLDIPEEKVPKLQAFLRSPMPLPQGAEKPGVYNKYETPASDLMREKSLKRLQAGFEKLIAAMENEPDFVAFHPRFGHMDANLALHLHYKHLRHHLAQFGIETPNALEAHVA